ELRPLLQFDGLHSLDLSADHPFLLDDASLLAMADAWPRLVSLDLGRYSGAGVTPPAFITLLERCPELKRLTIPLDFSAVDVHDFDPLPIGALRTHGALAGLAGLAGLELGPYRIAHAHAVAGFLNAVIPDRANITMLSSDFDEERTCRQSFRQTIKYLYQMRGEKKEQHGQ
ncbi:hypothetical protein BJ138DRAFT_1107423, partial [Hygrophoropsis aurantiaca]